MERHGALLVFKPGTSKATIARALQAIAPLVDLPSYSLKEVTVGRNARGQRKVRFEQVPFKIEDAIQEFDDEYGHPCFYIP